MAESESKPIKVTNIEAAKFNISSAVEEFARRYISMPKFDLGVEIMDQGQLRDAMGLRATIDIGDPWPEAEQELLEHNFRWHNLSGHRVMYLKERDDFIPDTGWQDAEEYKEDND